MKRVSSIIFFLIVVLIANIYSQTYLEKKEFSKIMKLYNTDDYKGALKGFKFFLNKYPSSYYLPDVYYYVAILEDDYYSSILTFRDLLVKFPDYKKADEAIYRLGKLYFLHNNYTEAIRTFETLQQKYPNSNFIYGSNYWLGVTHLIKGNYAVAIEYFEKVLNYNKKDDTFYILSLIGKANVYFEQKDYDKSIYVYREAMELNKTNYLPQIYLGMANTFLKKKVYDKAYYYYKMVLKKFSGTPEYEISLQKIKFIENNRTIFDKLNVEKIFSKNDTGEEKVKKYYTVQLASVKNKRYANDLRLKLKIQGYEAFMRRVETDKGVFYRTMAGKFKSRESALKLAEEIKHKFKLDGIVTSFEE